MIKQIYRFLSPKFQNLFMEYQVDFKPRYGHGKPPHSQLYEIINANRQDYQGLLEEFLSNKSVFQAIKDSKDEKNNTQPSWNNGFLPGMDIVALYSMIKHFKPNKYIEVGSGNSTKVAYKSIRDNNINTDITSIDPHPRAEISNIAQQVIATPFENIDTSFLTNLESGDILFIDNSHRVLPNSDAMVFFLEILPLLKKGVIVHIHDIYLPYDYPQFMCDRFYSEQYMLAAFILANPHRYRPIMPCFFVSEDEALKAILNPIWQLPNLAGVERHGGSFWMQICS